jgi:hypothetical protein
MSAVSDVKDLYGTLETTWTASRAHVVTHVVFTLIVFWLFHASLPRLSLPGVDANAITNNDWYKLVKETGLIYVVIVVPIVAASAYGAILGQLGQLFLTVTSLIAFSRRNVSPFIGLTEYDLEPLALLSKNDEFTLGELSDRAASLSVRFSAAKSELAAAYQKALTRITSNSVQYFGDFSVFLVFWIVLFRLMSSLDWVQANRTIFWPVTLVLLLIIILSWLRVARSLIALPRMQLQFLSAMLRADPEFFGVFDVSEENRNRVRDRLRGLLEAERAREEKKASLPKLIAIALGFKPRGNASATRLVARGYPFVDTFRRGERLAYDIDSFRAFSDEPAGAILAYLYYALYQRLIRLGRTGWHLVRFALIGVP